MAKLRLYSFGLQRQNGSVLVVGMIILVILMVGAVTMMNSSVQDEQISGNTKRSSNAFLAAEGGMHASLQHMTQKSWYDYRCNADGTLDVNIDGTYQAVSSPFLTDGSYTDTSSYVVAYLSECSKNADTGFITSLKYQSTGSEASAERVIVYSMSHGEASFPALFLNDNGNCSFFAGPSDAYNFKGNGGPAVSTGSSNCESSVETAITGKEDQYHGGVINHNPAPEFHKEEGLENFYNSLIPTTGSCSDFGKSSYLADSCVDGNLHLHRAKDVTYQKNQGFDMSPVDAKDIDDTDGTMGSTGDERVYVVHGDFYSTGNIKGAGVLLITGDAYFGGTPDWEGIIMVLGGLAEIGGGGNKDTGFNGTMIVSDVKYEPLPQNVGNDADGDEIEQFKEHAGFYPQDTNGWTLGGTGEIKWDVAGGGGGTYQYDCSALQTSHKLLTSMGATMSDFKEPDCAGGGSAGTFGDAYITDWYEEVNQ